MKKITVLLLALVMLLAAASAETVTPGREATLVFAYGDEAFTLHMLDIPNTIVYDGHTWLLEHRCDNFDAQFMMYGGNTRTVHEMSVPQFRLDNVPEGESLYLGPVRITPPGPMTLYVFSGDHTTGSFTLVDYQETEYYELPLWAVRDDNGGFVLTDMVFLYTFIEEGRPAYYAATYYIDYEGYNGSPASRAQIDGSTELPEVSQNDGSSLTPNVYLFQPDQEASARIAELEAEVEVQREYIAQLEISISTRDATIAGLEEQVANYEAMVPQLTADGQLLQQTVTEQEATIAELQSANATLQTQNTALTTRVTELERELAFYKGSSSGVGGKMLDQVTQQPAEPADYSTMTDEELLARRAELEAEMALIDAALAN